jgi:hypothetical protein
MFYVGFTWTTALVNTFLLPWIAISLFTTNISFTHDLLKLRKPCQETYTYSSIGINCMFSFMRRIKVQITFAQLSNFQKEKKKKEEEKAFLFDIIIIFCYLFYFFCI